MKRKREPTAACSAHARLKILIEWLNEVATCVCMNFLSPQPSMHRCATKDLHQYAPGHPSDVIGARSSNPPPRIQEVQRLCRILIRAVGADDGVAASALVSDGFLDTLAELLSTKCEFTQVTTFHLHATRLISSVALSSLENTTAVGSHSRLLQLLTVNLNHDNLSLIHATAIALADAASSTVGVSNVANPCVIHQTLVTRSRSSGLTLALHATRPGIDCHLSSSMWRSQALVCILQDRSGVSRLSHCLPNAQKEGHSMALTHCDQAVASEAGASQSDGGDEVCSCEEDSSDLSESESEEEELDAMVSNTLQSLVTLAEKVMCTEVVSASVYKNLPNGLVHRCLTLLQTDWRLLGTPLDQKFERIASKLVVRLGTEVSIQDTEVATSVFHRSSIPSIDTGFLKTRWEKSAILLRPEADNRFGSFPAMTDLQRCMLLKSCEAVLENLLPLCRHCPSPPADEVNVAAMVNVIGTALGGGPVLGHDINFVKTASATAAAPQSRSTRLASGISETKSPKAPHTGVHSEVPFHRSLPVSRACDEREIFWMLSAGGITEGEVGREGQSVASPAACKRAFSEGYSVAMRSVQNRIPEVAEVACQLARHLGQASVGANLYLTPPEAQGLKLHYDDHCVFVCQLAGRKRWRVYPRSGKLPQLYAPRECPARTGAAEEFVLRRGEVLYIPRGCPHEALTFSSQPQDLTSSTCGRGVKEEVEEGGSSLHLTFGVEVETPFTWEGFIHMSLHQWAVDGAEKLLPIVSVHELLECAPQMMDGDDRDRMALASSAVLLLLHAVVRQVADDDEAFKRACLMGGNFGEETVEAKERAAVSVDQVEGPLSTQSKRVVNGWVEKDEVKFSSDSGGAHTKFCRSVADKTTEAVLLQTNGNEASPTSHKDGKGDDANQVGSENRKVADFEDEYQLLMQRVREKAKLKEAIHLLLDGHRSFWDVEWLQWLYGDGSKVVSRSEAFIPNAAFIWLQMGCKFADYGDKLENALSKFVLQSDFCKSKVLYYAVLKAYQEGRQHFTKGLLALHGVDANPVCQGSLKRCP